MNPKVINLDHLIRDNAEILSRLLKPTKSLTLALNAASVNVRIDPAQLQQVLLNLTLNARDALREGGRVTISTSFRHIPTGRNHPRRLTDIPPGRYALVSISDNGMGMDAHTRAHLFEPFFTTKEQGKGTGLGLALVYGVVQQSGGHIHVHSAPNVGSTFDIFLPEVREPAQPIAAPLPSLPMTSGRETVLIVEEDDVVRKMVAGILTADGYTVVAQSTAGDGLVAAKKLRNPIDLLITQIGGQPGSDGEKLAKSLFALNPKLRVLGTCNPECASLPFLGPEAQVCLSKPFTLSALMKATRALLDGLPK
jgi:CheY-like chemotaxis protein